MYVESTDQMLVGLKTKVGLLDAGRQDLYV